VLCKKRAKIGRDQALCKKRAKIIISCSLVKGCGSRNHS
jgi:hypothetical protein